MEPWAILGQKHFTTVCDFDAADPPALRDLVEYGTAHSVFNIAELPYKWATAFSLRQPPKTSTV